MRPEDDYERCESHALQPRCPKEPILGPTRVALEVVKTADGYDFIEIDPVTEQVLTVEHLVTFEGRREAMGETAAE